MGYEALAGEEHFTAKLAENKKAREAGISYFPGIDTKTAFQIGRLFCIKVCPLIWSG